eukprot:m.174884 g.174884  ORF g.174884 m.174884 type:complete len:359 (-) comp18340_c0_seq2:81-1157(-)
MGKVSPILFYVAHGLMLFAGTTFGIYNVILKKSTDFPSTMSNKEQLCRQTAFMVYRMVGSCALLALPFIVTCKIKRPKNFKHWVSLVIQGVTGIYFNQYCFLLGVGHASANIAAVVMACSPVAIMMTAIALRMEKATPLRLTGCLVGIGGAIVDLGLDVFQSGRADAFGVTMLMLSLAATTVYTILLRVQGKSDFQAYSSAELTVHQFFYGSILMCSTSIYCYDVPAAFEHPGAAGWFTWLALGYAVFVSSLLNYWIMTWAATKMESTSVGMYGLVQPFATGLSTYVAYGTPLETREYIGTAMVVLSIVMINFEELSAGYHRRNSGSTATDIPKVASKDGDETTTLLSVAAPRINDDA